MLVTITDSGPTANAVTGATSKDATTLITTSRRPTTVEYHRQLVGGHHHHRWRRRRQQQRRHFTYDPTTSTSFETLPVSATLTDSFTYTVTDNRGVSSTATASVLMTSPTATRPPMR